MIRPLRILKRIKYFIYKLKLLTNIRIYDIIFITYLESITDSIEDLYLRRRLFIFIIIIEGEEEYKIEKLLRKRSIRRDRD